MKLETAKIFIGYGVLFVVLCGKTNSLCDVNWYFNLSTMRCKPCTICLEEFDQFVKSPCEEFKDTKCTSTPFAREAVLPSDELQASPVVTRSPLSTRGHKAMKVTQSTSESRFRTFSASNPEFGDFATDSGEEFLLKPIDHRQLCNSERNEPWKLVCYILACIVIVLSIVIAGLLSYICCFGQLGNENTIDMEKSVFTETDYNCYSKRRPRLFSRQLSTTEFLQSLNCTDKKHGSKEGLFDATSQSHDQCTARVNISKNVISNDNDVTMETALSDDEIELSNSDMTTNGKIRNKGRYSMNGLQMQDPDTETQSVVSDNVFSGQYYTYQPKEIIVNFRENGRDSITTSSYEI